MGLLSKVAKLAATPQGRAAIARAKDAVNDPKNRAKIEEYAKKARAKGGR